VIIKDQRGDRSRLLLIITSGKVSETRKILKNNVHLEVRPKSVDANRRHRNSPGTTRCFDALYSSVATKDIRRCEADALLSCTVYSRTFGDVLPTTRSKRGTHAVAAVLGERDYTPSQ
jgi:hypothetical protein